MALKFCDETLHIISSIIFKKWAAIPLEKPSQSTHTCIFMIQDMSTVTVDSRYKEH